MGPPWTKSYHVDLDYLVQFFASLYTLVRLTIDMWIKAQYFTTNTRLCKLKS